MLAWCSVLCRDTTILSRFLYCAVQTKYLLQGVSLDPLYEVLAWSFSCMARGVWPSTDEKGQAWTQAPRAR
eukprot:9554522-Alexandrium_andersonii.AAC.1